MFKNGLGFQDLDGYCGFSVRVSSSSNVGFLALGDTSRMTRLGFCAGLR